MNRGTKGNDSKNASGNISSDLEYLQSPRCIRERSLKIFDLCQSGKTHFKFLPENMPKTLDLVYQVTLRNYPDLKIPYHSRWGHFSVGGQNRLQLLDNKLSSLSPVDKAKAKWDLVIVSVLLDAGAGPSWKYVESETGLTLNRSEGLAVASFHMFMSGVFSSQKNQPYRVDAQGLLNLNNLELQKGLQVSAENPLVGLSGRLHLLQELGRILLAHPSSFGSGEESRLGNLLEQFTSHNAKNPLPALKLLKTVLNLFHPIWPGRVTFAGVNLGDVWKYPFPETNDGSMESLVPFHKLSQWLTYSLIEPLEECGIAVTGLHELTGLAEYRNGGLFVDTQVLQLRNPHDAEVEHAPEGQLIVEWRALTITLLDRLGKEFRKKLGMSEEEFPLTKMLEGGTWRAGREVALKNRAGGGPPLLLKSDGTVF